MKPSLPVLEVKGLSVFAVPGGAEGILRDVSFEVAEGETLGLLGPSGSGKSTTLLSILGLSDERLERRGVIRLRTRGAVTELTTLAPRDRRRLLGRDLGFVAQEPSRALDPVLGIGTQLSLPIRQHFGCNPKEARLRIRDELEKVGIDDPDRILDSRVASLSGGEQQRVLLAAAVSLAPRVLLLDEPTSAMDASLRRQFVKDLLARQRALGFTMILATHDLAVHEALAQKTVILDRGMVVESGETRLVLNSPESPILQGLLAARPRRLMGPANRILERRPSEGDAT